MADGPEKAPVIAGLPPNSTTNVVDAEFLPPNEGFCWFIVQLEADDGQSVEHFTSEDSKGADDARTPIFVASRELTAIMKTLYAIRDRLPEKT
jgi:hypothetical protein